MLVGALHCVKSWKRLKLLTIIIVAGSLALLIAPAAAVLLQPRIQNVPAGGPTYFLPVTPDQLWPSEVNGVDELSECFGKYAIQNIICASAGFESLRTYFMNFNSSFWVPNMMWGTYAMSPLVVQSLAGKIPRLLNSGTVYGLNRENSMLQSNAMTAILQDSLTGDWRDATKNWSKGRIFRASSEYRYADQRLSSVLTTSPEVFTRCAPAQNVSAGQSEINFSIKYWVARTLSPLQVGSSEWQDDEKPFSITILDGRISTLHSEWYALPTDQFGL